MAVHQLLTNTFSKPANADLSTYQYRVMYQVNDGDVDLLTNSGTVPLGILLNKPSVAKQAASIAGLGCIVKMEAGATIDEGQLVMADANGRGTPASGGSATWQICLALSPAASAEYFTLQVNPGVG